MTASPLPTGWWASGIQSSGWHTSPRRRASWRKTSAVSATVSVWPAFSRTAAGPDAVPEGRTSDDGPGQHDCL